MSCIRSKCQLAQMLVLYLSANKKTLQVWLPNDKPVGNMSNQTFPASIIGGILLIQSMPASATLISRLSGQAYYDTSLSITWVADANLAKSSGFDADGLMLFSEAEAWINSLNASSYLGFNDWRLPTLQPINGSAFDYTTSFDGSTDAGWNISAPGTPYAGSINSEMAYMFYNNLNLVGRHGLDGSLTGCSLTDPYCLTATSPFQNLQADSYWTGLDFERPDLATREYYWRFAFDSGLQGGADGTDVYNFA